MSTKDVFIFIRGGCLEAVTDDQGQSTVPYTLFDYDTDGVCPICQFEIGEKTVCPGCGYNVEIGTMQEAIRAFKNYENLCAAECVTDEGYENTVDMIAIGYEWICPACGKENVEIEALEKVRCGQCGNLFDANPPEHACP